ncbi:MAG: hypothetical protein II657_03540 [Clostridiales bacterium]|nr:hypothetical protein [Clostridiales bacterium]
MLDTVTLITLLAMGVLLCFYGFRMFRFSMAIAGFFMGFHAANLIDSLFLLEKIPEKGRTVFEFFFPIMFGIFIAVISYAIYKKALFFITVFFTWYSIVKIFLLYIVKTQNNLKLVVSLSPDKVAKLTDGSENTQNLIPDKQMNAVMSWLPGSTDGQKLLAICLIALVIAILTGILICMLQSPAIKIITAVIGADILRDVFLGTMGLLNAWKALPSFLSPVVDQGLHNGWISFFVWAALIGSGITVQFKFGDD